MRTSNASERGEAVRGAEWRLETVEAEEGLCGLCGSCAVSWAPRLQDWMRAIFVAVKETSDLARKVIVVDGVVASYYVVRLG
ncbi:hypothetical protein RHS01_03432 [Rhizoctonia solani]|uniref:Uncharacterized protein n=1 Tax=Rhizoctonia solani TaxID=456999 RepID=A0A8H7M6Z8_9AGAM|nr:hypothetical protein RHS01_03432 [Rhizoctonia solani]